MKAQKLDRYGRVAIALHWFMLVAVGMAYLSMSLADLRSASQAQRDMWQALHFQIGLLIFVLALLRGCVRLGRATPPIDSNPPALQMRLAWSSQLALYVFLFAMPVLGLLALNAGGGHLSFSGMPVPALIQPDESVSVWLVQAHRYLALAGYLLIGIHALAALVHHFYFRDNTLERILPAGQRDTGE